MFPHYLLGDRQAPLKAVRANALPLSKSTETAMQALRFPLDFQIQQLTLLCGVAFSSALCLICCAFAVMIQQTPGAPHVMWH